MKHTRCPSGLSQRGMGLAELMVGMTIGLILLAALGYFFLGSRQASRTHDDISRMQESGRHALELLGSAIRQAGYRSDADSPFAGTALTGTDGAIDTITVQFDAQPGGEADCAGANVAGGSLVTYAFGVNASRQLTCNGQPVVDHIENMQIEYGIDANKDGQIEAYKAAPTAAEFPAVSAVRVTLTVRGPTPNAATDGDGFLRQTYTTTYTVRNQAW
ncbi:MAG: PilW family protein [Gammaproteobacteria bacterium]